MVISKRMRTRIAKQIAESGANILFVAMTSLKRKFSLWPQQFIKKCKFYYGSWGSFDVVSGEVKSSNLDSENWF